jgi:hypothetical protein
LIEIFIIFFASLQYLKEQRLPPQTFIPLQSIRVKQIMERLRSLGGTAKLVFDVIQYPYLTSGYFEGTGCEGVYKGSRSSPFFFHPLFFPLPKFWKYKCNDVHLAGLIIFCTLQNPSKL